MTMAFVLGLSIFIQVLAATMALRLIRMTGWHVAWSLIAFAILLMAIRRSLTLYHLLSGDQAVAPVLQPELIALIVSFLMFAGIALLQPMFKMMQRAQADQAMATRALTVLGKLNHALTHITDEAELLTEACRILVDNGGYKLAWIGRAEHNAEKSVIPIAGWGPEKSYVDQIDITWADSERGQGPTGRAIREGAPQVVQNIHHDPAFAPWREAALKHGFAASVGLPLMIDGKIFGGLMIYAPEPNAFDETETRRLANLAQNLANGIRALRERAAHKETEATMAVHERHAREFQKMESLGKLAGGIAHHFNNALFGILGLSEIAMDDIPKDSPAREKIEKLRRVALDARDIVNQIVAFSRQSPPEYQPLDLAQALHNSLPLLYAALPSTIKIEQDIPMACPLILADKNQIKQIFFNLASNAADAINGQAGIITLTLAPVSLEERLSSFGLTVPPGDYLRLSVQDTGEGISADQLANIFDPFFTTKEVGQGSGMGLAVVHGFVTGHKGVITVDTDPDKGTTFHVLLPVISATETDDETGDE